MNLDAIDNNELLGRPVNAVLTELSLSRIVILRCMCDLSINILSPALFYILDIRKALNMWVLIVVFFL